MYQPTDDNIGEIQFASAVDAIIFSEEWAYATTASPGIFAKLLSKPGSGRLDRQDMIDIGHTISIIMAQAGPYRGDLLRCLYSPVWSQSTARTVAEVVAQQLYATDVGKTKPNDKIINLAHIVLKSERRRELQGKAYNLRLMASNIPIHRSQLYRGDWMELLSSATETVQAWAQQGIRYMDIQLQERGWLK